MLVMTRGYLWQMSLQSSLQICLLLTISCNSSHRCKKIQGLLHGTSIKSPCSNNFPMVFLWFFNQKRSQDPAALTCSKPMPRRCRQFLAAATSPLGSQLQLDWWVSWAGGIGCEDQPAEDQSILVATIFEKLSKREDLDG